MNYESGPPGCPKEGGGPLQFDGICVVVDMFSKHVDAFLVWEASPAETVAEQFCEGPRA